MTLGELAEGIAREYGEYYEDPDVQDQFVRWTNEAYKEVYGSAPWPFRNDTVDATITGSGAPVFSFAAVNNGPILSVRISETTPGSQYESFIGRPLAYVPIERLIARPDVDVDADTGRPRFWWYRSWSPTTSAVELQVYPNPAEFMGFVGTVLRGPQDLAETSLLDLPSEFEPLVAYGVRRRLLANEKDYSGAAEMNKEFERLRNQLLLSWTGPMGESSALPAKRLKAVHQAPLAQGAGA